MSLEDPSDHVEPPTGISSRPGVRELRRQMSRGEIGIRGDAIDRISFRRKAALLRDQKHAPADFLQLPVRQRRPLRQRGAIRGGLIEGASPPAHLLPMKSHPGRYPPRVSRRDEDGLEIPAFRLLPQDVEYPPGLRSECGNSVSGKSAPVADPEGRAPVANSQEATRLQERGLFRRSRVRHRLVHVNHRLKPPTISLPNENHFPANLEVSGIDRDLLDAGAVGLRPQSFGDGIEEDALVRPLRHPFILHTESLGSQVGAGLETHTEGGRAGEGKSLGNKRHGLPDFLEVRPRQSDVCARAGKLGELRVASRSPPGSILEALVTEAGRELRGIRLEKGQPEIDPANTAPFRFGLETSKDLIGLPAQPREVVFRLTTSIGHGEGPGRITEAKTSGERGPGRTFFDRLSAAGSCRRRGRARAERRPQSQHHGENAVERRKQRGRLGVLSPRGSAPARSAAPCRSSRPRPPRRRTCGCRAWRSRRSAGSGRGTSR